MKRRFNKKKGALFIEVLLGIFVMSLAAAAFYKLYPVLVRSERLAREESIAGQLSNRYIEHIQLLRPAELTASNLTQLQLIDTGQSSSPYSFSSIPLDQASGYSPARMLRNGTGVMTVTDVAGGSKLVRVTLSWTSASGKSRTFVTGTVLGNFR